MKTDRVFQIWQHELERLDQDHLLRKLPVIESSPTGRILMAGREIILLASNNYLGLSTEPTVVKAAQDALDKYGTGASGSRLLSERGSTRKGINPPSSLTELTQYAQKPGHFT